MEAVLEELYEGIMDGDMGLAEEKVQEALDAGIGAGRILNEGMIAAMAEVGPIV